VLHFAEKEAMACRAALFVALQRRAMGVTGSAFAAAHRCGMTDDALRYNLSAVPLQPFRSW
jgi:DMSO/TMAO reductase YedYZ heme-binding membrane subunit